MLSAEQLRKEFPILDSSVNGKRLIYLDNAATTQVPLRVLERLRRHYLCDNANVHRGVHALSERSTTAFEAARETVRAFLNAASSEEIIFTHGTTDSINAAAFGLRRIIHAGDTVVVTALEHHSNFLPWQRLCNETGAVFKVVPCPDGEPDLNFFAAAMRAEPKPKLSAITHVSNLTGTVLPLKEMIAAAHAAGALVLVDGAQAVRHEPVDVQEMDCDFYCFSGHKILAPAGIGVLYGKRQCLDMFAPAQVGGGMVESVSAHSFSMAPLPSGLEAGTPNYPGAIALAEALDYICELGRADVAERERELTAYAEAALSAIEGVEVLGRPKRRAGCVSFTVDGVHSYDAASVLDKLGVAVRSGTHCAQPALKGFGLETALRLSPAFYNTKEEIDEARGAIVTMMEFFKKWTKS